MIDVTQVIKLQERLESNDATFRSRWQDAANYMFIRESGISSIQYPGSHRKFDEIQDVTGITESERMTSGLLTNLVPAGQKFFALSTSDQELQELDIVKSYMSVATEILHEELFSSNYLLQLAETLRSLIVFGTGCLFVEWRDGLNFTDWDVARYQILENFKGEIDTILLKFPKTAQQAYEEWGNRAGKSITDIFNQAGSNKTKEQDEFWFIHIVRPRKERNPRLEDFMNMPFESGYINVKDKHLIDEGGFPEFPYMLPRWAKTSGEVHGRGIGTMILPQVKILNAMVRDFNEVGNKYANPHREVLDTFEGEYLTFPGARNDVTEIPSSHVDPNNLGSFPITEKIVELQRQVVKDAFYADAFAPITSTGTGDRRNELEIQQRIQEAFRKIGSPIGRLESELFTPKIIRSYLLLVRNGVIPEPPAILQGNNIKIMYKGPLSLAQQDAEIRASQRGIGLLAEMEQAGYTGAMDNVNVDNTSRRILRVLGANEEDIASEEEVAAKREQRRLEKERLERLQAAQIGANAYSQTTKAPESGSPAEQLQGVG